jgi:hypothetical protein
MAAVDHHLYAIGPSALVAIRQVTNTLADPRRRNSPFTDRPDLKRSQSGQRQHPFQLFATSDGTHGRHSTSVGMSRCDLDNEAVEVATSMGGLEGIGRRRKVA